MQDGQVRILKTRSFKSLLMMTTWLCVSQTSRGTIVFCLNLKQNLRGEQWHNWGTPLYNWEITETLSITS